MADETERLCRSILKEVEEIKKDIKRILGRLPRRDEEEEEPRPTPKISRLSPLTRG
jgi:hypothetical protein